MSTLERKYQLSKIAPGDYLLPSNDAQTIWRIAKYTDGPSQGLEIPRDRDFWGVWKWLRPAHGTVDPEDWAEWAFWDGNHYSRRDAVDAALGYLANET